MAVEILMPALSPTMTEGPLTRWLKNTGDAVRSGEVIAEIETDKATMEVEAVDEGRLARILVPAGTHGVAVNTPIAIILEEGEDEAALAEPTPKPLAVTDAGRLFASPLARRLAAEAGLDLASIRGSGPHGRIVRADIEAARAAPKPARAPLATAIPVPSPAPAPSNASPVLQVPPSAPTAKADGFDTRDWADRLGLVYRTEPLTTMRKVIARRLSESKQTVPHFYLSADCRIDSLLKMRAELNARSDAYKLSVNDFVIRAAALALKKVPAANAAYADDAILLFDSADISVAVATPAGLITPIVRKAEAKGLAAISAEMKDLAARAREGRLKLEEFQGGTFSISNLGMFGVRDFAAIINPPQACILAVGAAEPRPIVIDGALAVGMVMTCTLSVDHRVVDGAVGAGFMAAFKTLIEDPLSMLL